MGYNSVADNMAVSSFV